MPLSCGIPLGLIIVVAGVLMLFAAKSRKIGIVVMSLGATITLFALLVIVLAANSGM
jgi:hypothetical protein